MVDAWRGLAALGVVFAHLNIRVGFSLGDACVMVFFVISGYCIAAATFSCQRNNVGPIGYMWRRVRRIYPPYFFAVCFFVVTRLVKLRAGMGDELPRSLMVWIQNLSVTQWLSLLVHPTPSPGSNPVLFVSVFWSLNYEEQFYIVMGLLMFGTIYRGKGMLSAILLLMIPAFLWNLYHPSRFYGFFLEYWIAFALGTLVFYRLCKLTNERSRAAVDLGILFLLLFSLYRSATIHGSVYFEWIVTSSFALVLIHLRTLDGKFKVSTLGRVLSAFGLISYSLYLTHQLNVHISEIVASRLISLGMPQISGFFIKAAVMCSAATVFWYFCERPFLNKPLPNKTLAVNQTATVADCR
jgi:peptidoglycan/LPS O-acetylase OafA/YrhL